MDIAALHRAYESHQDTIEDVINAIYDRIQTDGLRPIWISVVPRESAIGRAQQLASSGSANLPLYGVPFAIKDNIDVAGMMTTAGCPDYAYLAKETATVVTRLQDAGAILIGKTNMDQFATGLVGTRTPYGICSSVFNAEYVSGGSSSGSAVAVASGFVSFALGTDTAGSGRVPAMFNNLVGVKPTRGAISTHGVVPACRTLDCVSIFAETAHDAGLVLEAAAGFDANDPYSRKQPPGAGAAPWSGVPNLRFGVPTAKSLNFFKDTYNQELYEASADALLSLGGEAIEFDLGPFIEVANLLYKGPWVAERYAAIASFIEELKGEMDPTVEQIIKRAASYSATDAFRAAYTLESLRRTCAEVWSSIDVMLLPTAPRTYTIEEIAEEPIERNSHLGYYTNFVNLLDLAAVALPVGMRPDGLPFGVSLIGPAFSETALLPLADKLHRSLATTLGGSSRRLSDTPTMQSSEVPHGCSLITVVGAHLSGQPLNWQLTDRGARLLRTCRTSVQYRFYALSNTTPPKPGLVRSPGFAGPGIEVEVWAVPSNTFGSFVDGVPQPLAIGTVELEDGTLVKGFLVEPAGINGALEITHLGGWRSYLATL